MLNLNQEDQPCQHFKAREVSPFHGGAVGHWCPNCDGTRYFCANCCTDHHEGGWQPCWDAKKAQECVEAFKPLADLQRSRDRDIV